MNFRRKVSSRVSRSIGAMLLVNEIEFVKSHADLKTSCSVTGDKLQTNFGILDSQK